MRLIVLSNVAKPIQQFVSPLSVAQPGQGWVAIAIVFVAVTSVAVNAHAQDAAGQASSVPVTQGVGHASDGDSPSEVAKDLETLARLWPSGRYRLTPGDVIQVTFPYVPEFDQTVSVQPDGYISLRAVGDVQVLGDTLPSLKTVLVNAYTPILRDPVISLVLKEFEKPYFVIGGQVAHPGKYDLRGATTLTQALALAGGPTPSAKSSGVVLFRRFGNDLVDVKQINVKKMFASRNLAEDPILRPGDTVFVPKSAMSAIAPFIPKPSFGFFLNPLAP
jgi:polysaccharide export outer membrane protein